MKRVVLFFFLSMPMFSLAQNYGLSFSYFIPNVGEVSTPISPFSLRGVGIEMSETLSIQTGGTLYRLAGLNIKGLPFTSNKSLMGPGFSLFIPAEVVLTFGRKTIFMVKGGGFGFVNFFQKINTGNFDRAYKSYQNWEIANGDLSFKNNPGIGFITGVELRVPIDRKVEISFGINYLQGAAKLPIKGNFIGYGNQKQYTEKVDFNTAKLDFSGLEFSIGISSAN